MLQLWDKHLTANTQFHDHSCAGCTIPAAQLPEPEVWNRPGSLPTELIPKILHGSWQTTEIHAAEVQTPGFQNFYINKVQKSILMQLVNEQRTNDTVSSSTQQQRFGLRKASHIICPKHQFKYDWNAPVSLGMHGTACRPTANATVELTYQNSPSSFSQLRWYFSFS